MTVNADNDGVELVRRELERGLDEFELLQFDVEHQLADQGQRAVAWTYTGQPKRRLDLPRRSAQGAFHRSGRHPDSDRS